MGREAKKKRERRVARKLGFAPPGLDAMVREASAPNQAGQLSPQQAINADRPRAEPWNTRYLEYARANDTPDPAVMLRRDESRFPGGKMVGFILWIGARWSEWREANGRKPNDVLSKDDELAFDAWLKVWVDEKSRRIIMPKPAEIVRPG